jgi:hypothetical protein
MKLSEAIVRVARPEIGVEEVNGTNCGDRVNDYKAATDLPPDKGWPWCAAFVCWCVREGMKLAKVSETPRFKRPQTASAFGFAAWSRRQDNSTQTKKNPGSDIQSGDIVIFTFSHIGIATGAPDKNGYVPTIEGNTDGHGTREGGAVLAKLRHISQIGTRIRFTI